MSWNIIFKYIYTVQYTYVQYRIDLLYIGYLWILERVDLLHSGTLSICWSKQYSCAISLDRHSV